MLFFILRRAPLAAIALTMLGLSANAAQFPCGSHEEISTVLDKTFKEHRQAMGLVSSTGFAELYISEQGTWTLVVTGTDMHSCVVAAGHSWESMATKEVQSAL
jgi:hypothetical protein